ncbi:MAG: hypothetical protein Q9207_006747 [Kuettlingeria erythrocarpa]
MTLTTAEQTLLTNIKLYLTNANSVLTSEGLKSLARMQQLKDILVKITDVSPKYGARMLRRPSQAIRDDSARREKEARKAQREEERVARETRRIEEREVIERRKADRLARKASKQNRQVSRGQKRRAQLNETSDDEVGTGNTLGAKAKRARTMPPQTYQSSPAQSAPESEVSSHESEQESREPVRDGHRFPRAAHDSASKELVNILEESRRPSFSAGRPSPIELNLEIAIFSQDEATIVDLTENLKTSILPEYIENMNPQKVDNGLKDLFLLCQKLNFDIVKHKILEFAEQREKKPSSRAQIVDLADNAEPTAIFHAIQVSAANEADAKLHRVFGQIQLVKSITRKLDNGYQVKTLSYLRNRDDASYLLQEMAKEVYEGELPETQKRTKARLDREYQAGRHWLKMIKRLGGMGAVLVFVFAEISCHAIANDYNDFQRASLAHIFDRLPSIKALIVSIGDHALEDFCRRGQLDVKTVDSIRATSGPEMLFSEGELSSGSVGSAESDAGYKVRRGRHNLKRRKYPFVERPSWHMTDEDDEDI